MSASSLSLLIVTLGLLVLVTAVVIGLLDQVGVDRILSTVGAALR